MGKLTLTKAFEYYGATPVNVGWACSAIASDRSIVFSAWDHMLKPSANDRLVYEDRLSRWKNPRGANLLHKHLVQARAENLPVRLILATIIDVSLIGTGEARKIPKTFSVHDDLVGRVTLFDGDRFVIEFHKTNVS
jgi:hypothetical protein